MDDKEKWIQKILNSTEGYQKSQAPPDLFNKIEQRLDQTTGKIIPIHQWRVAAAAAIILMVLNLFGLRQYIQNNSSDTTTMEQKYASNEPISSTYQLYK